MRFPFLEDAARALSLSSALQKPILSNEPPQDSVSLKAAIPDGPFNLCEVSRSTDLFDVTSVSLSKRPVYIDDAFLIHLYGNFQKSFAGNGTLELNVNCGSHCEEYGAPVDSPGESTSFEFCEMSNIEQPLHGKKATCPPKQGFALISSPAYVIPMFLNVPGWYNFTFDAKTDEGERIYCLQTEVCLRWEDEDRNKGYPPGPWNNCTWPR